MPLEAGDITELAKAIKNLQQPAQAPVNATAVKLPSFWQGNPEVWLRQVEIALGFLFDSINAVQPGLDYQAMASAQTDDPDVQASASRMSLSPTGPSRYFAMYPLASRDQWFPKPGAD